MKTNMKLEIETAAALSVLAHLKNIARGKSTLPVLGCVLIETGTNAVTFTVSDLDRHLSMTILAKVTKAGKTLVSCSRLFAILSRISGEVVELELVVGTLCVAAGGWTAKLLSLSPEEFPEMASNASGAPGHIAAAALRRFLKLSAHFLSRDETRYALNGVCIRPTSDGAESAATDGRRLLVLQAEGVKWPAEVIIPAAAVSTLTSLLSAEDADSAGLKVSLTGNSLFLEASNWIFCTKRVEGNFPNFAGVIPSAEKCQNRVTVMRDALQNALSFVAALATDNNSAVRLEAAGESLKAMVNSPEVGEALASIPAGLTGNPPTIALNRCFFAELLSVMDGEEMTLQLGDGIDPVLVEEHGFLSVLMPMRIQ